MWDPLAPTRIRFTGSCWCAPHIVCAAIGPDGVVYDTVHDGI